MRDPKRDKDKDFRSGRTSIEQTDGTQQLYAIMESVT